MSLKDQSIYMIVKVGQFQYAINIKQIKSIIDNQKIIYSPSIKKGLYGFVNVGNFLIPIFDEKVKTNQGQSTKSERNRVLILSPETREIDLVFGILVNDILTILNETDFAKHNLLSENDNQIQKIEILDSTKYLTQKDIDILKEYYSNDN